MMMTTSMHESYGHYIRTNFCAKRPKNVRKLVRILRAQVMCTKIKLLKLYSNESVKADLH